MLGSIHTVSWYRGTLAACSSQHGQTWYVDSHERWTHVFVLGPRIIRLIKRRRCPFLGGAHAQRNECLSNLLRDLFEHVFAVLAKVEAVAAVACPTFEDRIIQYDVQVAG